MPSCQPSAYAIQPITLSASYALQLNVLCVTSWSCDNRGQRQGAAALFISGKTLGTIFTMCRNPRCSIHDLQVQSAVYTQQSGVRQGCPLSTFLFIILMTVLFIDGYDTKTI